ncbi:MAG: type I DNA topoisomerase [Rhodospirillales bacterium]|nr:type I DNA topoisomerase [Rhodospirillales bacterium]
MPENVVVVESPAKAKTINKYLGSTYKVLASFGHVRDLSPKDGSVLPDNDFAMDWQIDSKAEKHIKEIAKACRGAERLYLATDPDREGEAISWHMQQVLDERGVLDGMEIKRVVFNEITQSAITGAFEHPRDLNKDLVEAYLARRALDYLVGFTLSPVLWRKLPGCRSAGRVQSVALRLVCEREAEIEIFNPNEYWTVKSEFAKTDRAKFTAHLTHLGGRKLDKLALGDKDAADQAVSAIEAGSFSVTKVERKQSRRNPAPPFTTSTLQQEAARKLHFSARKTMQVAQRLYEGVAIDGETVGLITYMRTDGVQMANEAIDASRGLIGQRYGDNYVPGKPRVYKTRAKNAQEAHEAIRPTDVSRTPEQISNALSDEQMRLYTLIWKRTIASQMEAAVLDQVGADIAAADGSAQFRATGSVIAFDGFFKLYREGRDDPDRNSDERSDDDGERMLPDLREGEALDKRKILPEQHFTQPPPRYSEASLVKRLEELGIGRPSTYATILSVLQDRDYVRLEKRRFLPEDRGRLVTAFLSNFFPRYVEYDFTANLEDQLDEVSGGRVDWKGVLVQFWGKFNEAVDATKDLRTTAVLNALNDTLGRHFFGEGDGEKPARACPTCEDGELSLKIGRYGAFIGCSNYPECRYTRKLVAVGNGDGADEKSADNGPRVLGTDPETSLEVTLRQGPYGHYVQLGEPEGTGKKKTKPKRASLAKNMTPDSIDLSRALALLSLPRDIGPHNETGEMISAGIGRYGPYIRYAGNYLSLKGEDDILTIGLNRAIALIADAPQKEPAKTLGDHPKDKKPVTQRSGRFGPYVQHGTLRATLPKGTDADTLTLEAAVEILAGKAERAKGKGKGGTKAKTKAPARSKSTKSKKS